MIVKMAKLEAITVAAALLPLALAAATASTSAVNPGSTSTVAGLNVLAKAHGKVYFGTATDNPELTNTAYVANLDNIEQFGQITPANSMKWDATEPEQGVFTFEAGDVIANLAKQNGQLLRGHNCVWSQQLPDWVTAGDFSASELTEIVTNHTATVVGHYKGQVFSWDVVNEPFNDDGTFQSNVFFDTLGQDYISIALTAARNADPNAKLFINDFGIEGTGAKSTGMVNLVKQLKKDGVPIDGIGIEGHLIVGEVPTTLVENFEQFTALGVDISVNELDVRMTLPATDALLDQQKQDYQTVVAACNAVPGCIGITLWDWTDLFSWVPGAFPGQGAACPWDENFNKKPAFDGIVMGFQG